MRYLRGAYAEFASLPAPTTTTLHSAREIDFATKLYVLDTNGNPAAMSDVVQRVMLVLSYATPRPPAMISDGDFELRRQTIATALRALEDEGAIRVDRITVEVIGYGAGRERIDFTDLQTQQSQSVTIP